MWADDHMTAPHDLDTSLNGKAYIARNAV